MSSNPDGAWWAIRITCSGAQTPVALAVPHTCPAKACTEHATPATLLGVWPIKCPRGSKTNKSNCQFWKNSTYNWLVDNPSQDLFGQRPQIPVGAAKPEHLLTLLGLYACGSNIWNVNSCRVEYKALESWN
jgi:hypothetical protein